jgi:uncharacterized protein
MRLLAFADEPPPADAGELVAANEPELVVTLGDLKADWIASLASTDVPKLGVHGNHDADDELTALGIRDLHMSRAEVGGWSFAGFEGSVLGHAPAVHQYSQEEATRYVEKLPPADVLLTHSPPLGVNDEPDDPTHVGFGALREWVERHGRATCCTGTQRPTHARASGASVPQRSLGARRHDDELHR